MITPAQPATIYDNIQLGPKDLLLFQGSNAEERCGEEVLKNQISTGRLFGETIE